MEGIDGKNNPSLGQQNHVDQVLENQEEANKKGGWITFPFIIGNLAGLSVAAGGWGANWIVFLIKKFNIGSITATKINNVGFGFVNLFPVVGAIIADSFAGNFAVVAVSSFIALIGMIMLTLIAGIDSLRPKQCLATNTSCDSASVLQYFLLYTAMGLTCLGVGGSRFTVATMGADQFNEGSVHQATYFNWYFIVLYIGNAFSFLVLVYVEDNVGWGLGFGLCALSAAIALAVFLIGKPFYRSVKLKGSPFASMARVVVAAIRKRNTISSEGYYFGEDCEPVKIMGRNCPSKGFGLLNSAALKTENDRKPDGSYPVKSWRLCSVQEVEDLKTVIKILPLWSSGILLSITIAILNSLTTVQALTMDRNLGSIEISAGTFLVFSLAATAASILLIDRAILPACQRLRGGRGVTLLQRIGTGHVINAMAMVGSALIESKRLSLNREAGPRMSAFWLVGTLAMVGFGEAFQFPGQISLYYQDFPKPLRSTSTAMISLLIGLGYYLSAAFTDFVNGITGWMPNDINRGRLDNVYWLCAVIGVLNFGFYLVCAWYYEYQHDPSSNSEDGNDDGARSS